MYSFSNSYKKHFRKKIAYEVVSHSKIENPEVALYIIRLATLPTGTAHQGEFSIFTGGKDEIC
jgi:hypothetical protein